jgi:glycosyltransferase involved in cell wall biosynthesis
VVFTNHTRYHLQARYVPIVPEALTRAFVEAYLPSFTEQCDLVVVPSEGVRRDLEEVGVACPMEVIPNGVDVAQFRHPAAPLSKDRLDLPHDALLAVTVCRLGPEKNLPFMLRAFVRIAGEVPDLHLVVIGGGPDREALEEIVHLRGLGSRVHLVGEVAYEDVPNWLAMADFFVFSSVEESHPLAVLEALAAGLPVLGIPCAGVEDTIEPGVNGLSSSEDEDVFAAKMRRLAVEPDLRARLAAGARETGGQYDIHHTSAKLMVHYERLAEARRSRQAEVLDE